MKARLIDLQKPYKAFKGVNGLYGYKNLLEQVVISPVYKYAQDFTHTGFAVAQNLQGYYGVFDSKSQVVKPFVFDKVELYSLKGVTLMYSFIYYRGYERFLRFNYFSSLLDKEFDLKDIYPLFKKYRVLQMERLQELKTQKTLAVVYTPLIDEQANKNKIKVGVLNPDLVLINQSLYRVKKGNIKKVVKDFIGLYDCNSKAVGRSSPERVKTYNMNGKAIKSYEIIPNSCFTIYYKGKEYLVIIHNAQSSVNSPTVIYRDTQKSDRFYVNGAFEMFLPPHITDIQINPGVDLVD